MKQLTPFVLISLLALTSCQEPETNNNESNISMTTEESRMASSRRKCQSSSPTLTISQPSIHLDSGASASVAATLKNNNSNCSAQSYSFAYTSLPSGITSSLSNRTLKSGQTVSFNIPVSAASSVATGVYNLSLKAADTSNASYSSTKSFSLNVTNQVAEPQAVKAFPTAEGYAKNVTGGRGGAVVKVTNLNNSGPGSFRDAVSGPNRIVVFEVAGYINLTSTVNVASNITIAGQTAFRNGGQGITLRKSSSNPFSGPMVSGGSNLIVRYMRFRPGQRQDNDCCGDAWVMYQTQNIIFDHVSASYSSDEMFDFTGSQNITIQNSFFSEPLSENNPASNGKIFQGGFTKSLTFYRNLIANSGQRNPALSPLDTNGTPNSYEYINNYAFNIGMFGLSVDANSSTPVYLNVVNNYWHDVGHFSRRWVMLSATPGNQYYVAENNFDSRYKSSTTGNAWNLITANISDYSSNFTLPMSTAYQKLSPHNTPIINDGVELIDGLSLWPTLRDEFGASLHRDAADIRVVNQIDANSAPSNTPSPLNESAFGTAYSALANMTSVPVDTNNDGIPDVWAAANMPNGVTASDTAPSGYTWIEEYINEIEN